MVTRPARLAIESRSLAFEPHVENLPDLPPVDWQAGPFTPPQPLDTPATLPPADVVVLAWADAEWAAMHHVFCASDEAMPYSDRDSGHFPGWQEDPSTAAWRYWGYFHLAQVGDTRVLLYKSNIHLDEQGAQVLSELTQRLATTVRPRLIISTGTAGGANNEDHVGTVPIVKAATVYEEDKSANEWPTYSSTWTAPTATLDQAGFAQLLMPIPITEAALQELASQFNEAKRTEYTLEQLDPDGLNRPTPAPVIRNLSEGSTSLLTASSFLVGTIDDKYDAYACIEMDDAIVAAACAQANVEYCSVRNLSDPAQSPALSSELQSAWGSTIYRTYGLYTSLNGALAAWAVIA